MRLPTRTYGPLTGTCVALAGVSAILFDKTQYKALCGAVAAISGVVAALAYLIYQRDANTCDESEGANLDEPVTSSDLPLQNRSVNGLTTTEPPKALNVAKHSWE